MNTRTLLQSLICCTFLLGPPRVTAQSDTTFARTECSLLLHNGRKLQVNGIRNIAAGRLEYEAEGSLHDIEATSVRTVQCGARRFSIMEDTLVPIFPRKEVVNETAFVLTDLQEQYGGIDYRALGKADAKAYYRGGGNFVVGLLTGTTVMIPMIVAAIPPVAPKLKHNPNAALYEQQPDYRVGYRSTAHTKKAALTISGMAVGFMLVAGVAGL